MLFRAVVRALVALLAVLAAGPAHAQCPYQWDPGHYDRPLSTVVVAQGELGLGFVRNGDGDGPHGEAAAHPWYFGGDAAFWRTLGTPAVKVLLDARYGVAFGLGPQKLNTPLWAARGAILFGGSHEEVAAWNLVLSQRTEGISPGTTVTTTDYCPQTSAYRSNIGFGAGAQIDRLSKSVAFTLNVARIGQVYRQDSATMFEGYLLWGPSWGLDSGRFGMGATLRVISGEGAAFGGAIEAWTQGGFGVESGALLITLFGGAGFAG